MATKEEYESALATVREYEAEHGSTGGITGRPVESDEACENVCAKCAEHGSCDNDVRTTCLSELLPKQYYKPM